MHLRFVQGGFIPDLILYLSYFYTKSVGPSPRSYHCRLLTPAQELPIRLAWFWISSNVCNIVSSFLAYGILHMRGVLGKAGWRWLFLIECVRPRSCRMGSRRADGRW
jgi:hypothetical protein